MQCKHEPGVAVPRRAKPKLFDLGCKSIHITQNPYDLCKVYNYATPSNWYRREETVRKANTLERFKLLSVVTFGFSLASAANGQQFHTSDHLVLLVKSSAPVSSFLKLGYSGKCSSYVSTGTNSNGTISFSVVSMNIDCERDSTTDIDNLSNYGKGGYVPPGIYFLHYHRLDLAFAPLRHRLGLSDAPGAETIKGPSNTRTNLQFHRAFNDLQEFKTKVSEGCITLTEDNFFRLFPSPLFDGTQSPLAPGDSDENPLNLHGSPANVIVFITDAGSPGKQDSQLRLFESARSNLRSSDFNNNSAGLNQLRISWK